MPWRSEDGKIHTGTYESWIDKQIREAQERGDFDDLPSKGKPLAGEARPDDPDWWIKQKVVQEGLDLTAGLPLPLQLRKEAETLRDRILEEMTESSARALVENYNDRVRASWSTVGDGPPILARTVDVEELVEHWRSTKRAAREVRSVRGEKAEPDPARLSGLLYRMLGRLRRRPPLAG